MAERLLVGDPDPSLCELILNSLGPDTQVDCCTTFGSARTQLLAGHYDLLVTNVRLHTHNGVQLVYALQFAQLPTRSVVYDVFDDPVVARDARASGAFYESYDRLQAALPGYLRANLPPKDRRTGTGADRRRTYRPGRRRADLVKRPGSAAM